MPRAAHVGLPVVVAHVAVHDCLGLGGRLVGTANLGVVDGNRPEVVIHISFRARKKTVRSTHTYIQRRGGVCEGGCGGDEVSNIRVRVL